MQDIITRILCNKNYIWYNKQCNILTGNMIKEPDAGCKGTCYHLEMRYNHGTFHQTLCTARGPKSSRNSVRRPISEWITEAAMIGVTRLLGSNEGVVLVALNNISIQKPTVAGAILDFYMEKGTPPLHQYSHLYYGKTYADRPGTCQRNRYFRYRG